MTKTIIWEIPIKTVSEANVCEHWSKSSKRHRQQQFFVRSVHSHEGQEITLPCTVKMIRRGPRVLDDDNLRMAFKWIRDEISECLLPEKSRCYISKDKKLKALKGRADDDMRIRWEYDQEKTKEVGIRIEIHCD